MPKKCSLFLSEVLYFGHVVNSSGISPDPAKLANLKDWPVPRTVRYIQSFLNFVNLYGDFIASATALTNPLFKTTARRIGTETAELLAAQLTAFEELKRRHVANPQLAHLDLTKL